ncbi:MAG: bifunctional phosphoserine phosphatase/homoserine phosphotransferase ThrH [Coriobacteriia bacterium]|nr:bifunctional phosphoserine phosphatase/homoserine phosphotransferase ThrH [Coriobacteriia bacterium]
MQHIVCLDLEGTLVPEIWIAVADAANIPELRVTTREEPDYDKLMKMRIATLREHGLTIADIQKVIAGVEPLPGAKEFLDELRTLTQVVILSDTFTQFAKPVMEKLGWPTIFCNALVIDGEGFVTDYEYRVQNPKYVSVRALESTGFQVIAAGDSHNDLPMIKVAKAGFLMNAPEAIIAENPDVPAFNTYPQLMAAIKEVLTGE